MIDYSIGYVQGLREKILKLRPSNAKDVHDRSHYLGILSSVIRMYDRYGKFSSPQCRAISKSENWITGKVVRNE